jgi:hypothetical protein
LENLKPTNLFRKLVSGAASVNDSIGCRWGGSLKDGCQKAALGAQSFRNVAGQVETALRAFADRLLLGRGDHNFVGAKEFLDPQAEFTIAAASFVKISAATNGTQPSGSIKDRHFAVTRNVHGAINILPRDAKIPRSIS